MAIRYRESQKRDSVGKGDILEREVRKELPGPCRLQRQKVHTESEACLVRAMERQSQWAPTQRCYDCKHAEALLFTLKI